MKKLPKLSKAILESIEKFPIQAHGVFVSADGEEACAIGGAMEVYKTYFSEKRFKKWDKAMDKFEEEYGLTIYAANDGIEGIDDITGEELRTDPIPRDIIAGMLMAIGK